MQLSDYITQVQFLLHDQTNADFSTAELTNAINNARTATALDFHCCRVSYLTPPNPVANPAYYAPVSIIQNQEIYPLNGFPGNGLGGVVSGANVTAGGTGYTNATTVTFNVPQRPGGVQATAVPVISGGVITSINVTRWGTGYHPNGNLRFFTSVTGAAAGTGGVVRLAVTTTGTLEQSFQTNDFVTVELVGGTTEANGTFQIIVVDTTHIELIGTTFVHAWTSGGTVTDNTTVAVVIADSGGGTGAAAVAVMFNNVFNVISISNIWGNQRYMLRFRGFTLFQAYMRSQLYFYQRPTIWTIQEQTGVVIIAPPPDQPYQTEWDVLVSPIPLLFPTDPETQISPPYDDAVQYYAAHYCLNKLQNFNQAEYYLKLYSARVPKIIIGAGGIRIPNPYHKTFQRRVSR